MKSAYAVVMIGMLAFFAKTAPAERIVGADTASDDMFGQSVAVGEDRAVIGALFDDDNGSSSGAAYVFRRESTNWVQEAKLSATDALAGDQFGKSVAISGDYILVGAHTDDDRGSASGSAYVFRREGTNWMPEAKLLAGDGAAEDYFGAAVALDGDYAVIGAWGDDYGGAAYAFHREGTNWTQQSKLVASDNASGDQYGYSVSLYGDCAAVGAWQDDDLGAQSGSAYVFRRGGTNWAQEANLAAADAASSHFFGAAVSVHSNRVLVGAADTVSGFGCGEAYLFCHTGSNWQQEAKLIASNALAGNRFGASVSLFAEYAAIGAPDALRGSTPGQVYVFKRDGPNWTQQANLVVSSSPASDQFGKSVAVHGDYLLVGSPTDSRDNPTSGSAYLFTKTDTDEDNLPDWWELQHFRNLSQTGGDDPDGDSYTNGEEYRDGTEPMKFDVGAALIWTAVEIGWKSVPGRNYQVQCCSDLVSNDWQNLGAPVVGTTGTNSVFDSIRATQKKFYRVTVP